MTDNWRGQHGYGLLGYSDGSGPAEWGYQQYQREEQAKMKRLDDLTRVTPSKRAPSEPASSIFGTGSSDSIFSSFSSEQVVSTGSYSSSTSSKSESGSDFWGGFCIVVFVLIVLSECDSDRVTEHGESHTSSPVVATKPVIARPTVTQEFPTVALPSDSEAASEKVEMTKKETRRIVNEDIW